MTRCLNDSRPKQLYTELPPIHLAPVQHRKKPTAGVYRSPVYKVRARRDRPPARRRRCALTTGGGAQILSRHGVLSTTGHSTNFVMYIELPHDRRSIVNNVGLADCDTWIKAGVAAFCALRY